MLNSLVFLEALEKKKTKVILAGDSCAEIKYKEALKYMLWYVITSQT